MANKSFQKSDNKPSGTDRVVAQFCDTMIQTIEGLKHGWRKTWITTEANGEPQNLTGRKYNAFNQFFLYMVCEANQFKYPVFLTINQANEMGCHVKKGSKSAPVLFWTIYATDKNGKRISIDEWKQLSPADQEEYDTHPVLKYYNVFNIEQTDFADMQPEKLKKVTARFTAPEYRGTDGMYANSAIDKMIEKQTWVCPIKVLQQDRAFYNSREDFVQLPTKEQYNLGGSEEDVYTGGMEYYINCVHECAHSTGNEKRLNRLKPAAFGSEDYAREELVAELTAALIGHSLGFNTKVMENNAAYLDSWLKTLKKEPKFLVSVLADVNKAANMIEEHISAMAEKEEVA